MITRIALTSLLVLSLAGCAAKPSQSKDAVQSAIVNHLKKRDDMMATSMKVVVDSVNFRDKEADAVVTISPREGGSGIQMTYSLVAEGSGWVVKKSSAQTGGSPHSVSDSPAPLPSGHPPVASEAPSVHPPAAKK